ncbi:MAG: hypothetical protein OXU69_08840 [Gemmatimonadota bacterium]|nr:hypothetical protein [Gemmatimonadota bacterium]
MNHRTPAVAAAALLAATVACRDGANPRSLTPVPVLRDSAGVHIAENPRPPAGSGLGWEVGPEPAVRIGSADGEDPYLFHRVWDMATLGNGRIAVADAGSEELRVFDSMGVHLATWGGRGEGPGEFQSLWAVARWPDDSVAAWEFHSERGVSIFDSEGDLGRILRYATASTRTDVTVLRNSAILTDREVRSDRGRGLQVRHRLYQLLDAEGTVTASLGPYPASEMFERRRAGTTVWMEVPFTRSAVTAAWHDLAVVGRNDIYEIRAYGTDGALRRMVRMDHAPVPVTRSLLTLEQEEQGLGPGDDEIPAPETLPAFDRVIADALDHLWVREYRVPGRDTPHPLWTVFDPEGRVLGHVATPPGLGIFEIGEGYVLGLAIRDLGVQQVQVWPLRRGEG